MKTAVLSLVQRAYAAFDLDVQLAPQLSNTTSDTYLQGIASQLSNSETGSCWLFCVQVYNSTGAANIGSTVVTSPLFALTPTDDVGGTNAHSDMAIVVADQLIASPLRLANTNYDTGLANYCAYASGRCFGLQDTFRDSGGSPNRCAVGQERRDELQLRLERVLLFYQLYHLQNPTLRRVNNYSLLANSARLGVNSSGAAYVTGTGANDTIDITWTGATTAHVTVTAYSDAAHTSTAGDSLRVRSQQYQQRDRD